MSKIKRPLKTRLAALAAVSAAMLAVQPAFAAEINFSSEHVYPIDAMERLASVPLEENENTIALKAETVKNEAFYISIYEKGEDAKYIVKYLGPVDISDFKIIGLEGGKEYYVNLSSLGNTRSVEGKIITSYTEVQQ